MRLLNIANKIRLRIPLLRDIHVRKLARQLGVPLGVEITDLLSAPSRPIETRYVGVRRLEIVPPDPEQDRRIAANNRLVHYAHKVTSQDGEDGVLAHILKCIGIDQGWCVEFGAWDGKFHSNTWDLVHNKGWKAIYIEPDLYAFPMLLQNCEGLPDIYCFNDTVSWEGEMTLDRIFARTPIPHDFDLMVVDIDGNDFYVWRACEKYRPKVVMIEFNPFIPTDIRFVKNAEKNVKASASLLAIYELGKAKDYEMVCVVGGNAIFVRKEYFLVFAIADNHPLSMHRSKLETKIFQGYDGNLFLAGNRHLIWRHQIDWSGRLCHLEIDESDIQVLPKGLRVFRPRLSYKNPFLEERAGRIDCSRVPSNRLLAFQHNVTSENGEDGILQHIFEEIGVDNGFCTEVGAYDGKIFSNTWTLIHDKGWQAMLIEKDAIAYSALRMQHEHSTLVQAVQVEVTTRNETSLDSILAEHAVPADFEFLCIDVEGNDYHLWASLKNFRPKVVMVDFNSTVPNDVIFVQEDDLKVNHGASLRAFVELGKTKGYELAAVTTWNAIFVRSDLFSLLGIYDNRIERMYYPVFEMKVFQSIDCYLSTTGCDRLVRHNYVFDPEQIQPVPQNIRILPFMTEILGKLVSTFFG